MLEPCKLLWISLAAVKAQKVHFGLRDPNHYEGNINQLIMVVPNRGKGSNLLCMKDPSHGTWKIGKKLVKVGRRVKKE